MTELDEKIHAIAKAALDEIYWEPHGKDEDTKIVLKAIYAGIRAADEETEHLLLHIKDVLATTNGPEFAGIDQWLKRREAIKSLPQPNE